MPPPSHVLSVPIAAVLAAALGACGARASLLCTHDVAVVHATPNVYFVLDHSSSMREHGKWESMKWALSGLVASVGARARFGAAMFPAARMCGPGVETMSVRPGSPETAATLADAMAPLPIGGTPTAATLSALAAPLSELDGRTFVLLATDGGPNCNEHLACDADRCTPNMDASPSECLPGGMSCCAQNPGGCLDDDATVVAIEKLRGAGIPTFVVGVPGSEAYGAVLDRAAKAGGMPRRGDHAYYRVDTADAQALSSTLQEVVAQVAATPCLAELGEDVSPDEITVFAGGTRVPKSPTEGFTTAGPHLLFHGAACDLVATGARVTVRAEDDCPSK